MRQGAAARAVGLEGLAQEEALAAEQRLGTALILVQSQVPGLFNEERERALLGPEGRAEVAPAD